MEPLNGLPFAPSVEPLHDDAVLTKHSNELFVNGKFNTVPFMIGFTAQEASIVQDGIVTFSPSVRAHSNIAFSNLQQFFSLTCLIVYLLFSQSLKGRDPTLRTGIFYHNC